MEGSLAHNDRQSHPKQDGLRLKTDAHKRQKLEAGCKKDWTAGNHKADKPKTCQRYIDEQWCTKEGRYGQRWKSGWGSFEDYADADGNTALVCPQCGCNPESTEENIRLCRFVRSNCEYYVNFDRCDRNGVRYKFRKEDIELRNKWKKRCCNGPQPDESCSETVSAFRKEKPCLEDDNDETRRYWDQWFGSDVLRSIATPPFASAQPGEVHDILGSPCDCMSLYKMCETQLRKAKEGKWSVDEYFLRHFAGLCCDERSANQKYCPKAKKTFDELSPESCLDYEQYLGEDDEVARHN